MKATNRQATLPGFPRRETSRVHRELSLIFGGRRSDRRGESVKSKKATDRNPRGKR